MNENPITKLRERLHELYDAREKLRRELGDPKLQNTEAVLYKLETLAQVGDSISEVESMFRRFIRGNK